MPHLDDGALQTTGNPQGQQTIYSGILCCANAATVLGASRAADCTLLFLPFLSLHHFTIINYIHYSS